MPLRPPESELVFEGKDLPAAAQEDPFLEDGIKDHLFELVMRGKLILKRCDITTETTDAIVNPANKGLFLGSGIAGAVQKKGGEKVEEECAIHTQGGVKRFEVGDVVITTGGNLKPSIMHAVIIPQGGQPDFDIVRMATRNIIIAAKDRFKTLSIPAMGAGMGGMEAEESAAAIRQGLVDVATELVGFDQMNIVTFDPETYHAFHSVFSDVL